MKGYTMTYRTHNPCEESHWVSRLRENLTSGSDGEGLETGQLVPRQSFTRQQIFRLLKHQGFGIEETELESGWAIRKLVIIQMTALLKILQMNIAYSQPEGGQPIEEVFDAEQIEVLHLMNKKLQGRTTKLQNHHDPKRTKWAAWVIGRLGGWKGYDSQGPPGVIVLKRGLDRLSSELLIW